MLTARQIAEADYVIIAADVAIEGIERFRGKKIYRISIKPVLKDTRQVFLDMEAKAEKMGETAGDDEKKQGKPLCSHLPAKSSRQYCISS